MSKESVLSAKNILFNGAFLPSNFKDQFNLFIKHLWDFRHTTIFLAGNGGSSSTASHFSADLANLNFKTFCLCDNIVRLTALTNDKGWENVYVEEIKPLCNTGDILIIASVHGGIKHGEEMWSGNLLKVAKFMKEEVYGKVLALLGGDGGEIKKISNISLIVPSSSTYVVEGIHSIITHAICEELKEKFNRD